MIEKHTYKKQGNGQDSWRVDQYEGEILINSFMVYENPEKKVDISNVDLNTLTPEHVSQLKKALGL